MKPNPLAIYAVFWHDVRRDFSMRLKGPVPLWGILLTLSMLPLAIMFMMWRDPTMSHGVPHWFARICEDLFIYHRFPLP